jgi:sec-independent protein translocase protein TatC
MSSRRAPDYPDDIFADTRMSFGDHIEELRTRLIRAVVGLLAILIGGFVLDGVGQALKMPNVGIGKPMMAVIVDPVESQVRDFYRRRNQAVATRLPQIENRTDPVETKRILDKLDAAGGVLTALSSEERAALLGAPREMPVVMPVAPLAELFGPPKKPEQTEVTLKMMVYPAYLNYLGNEGEALLGNKQYLTTLSVQEAFVVYFQVSLLCGVVIGSPWIFYQIWAFVAAGLYPHEKKIVYRSLSPAVTLFVSGAMLCQFIVLPGAVKALLGFNEWIGLDPDLRLREWLGFALILPLVFGISFQTPLVMFVMNRLGTFTAQDYLRHWRGAVMALAVFSAIITPTPDVFTMSYLFIPMFGLYLLGVAVCHFFPPDHESAWDEAEEIAV